jgi:hypothetical protein
VQASPAAAAIAIASPKESERRGSARISRDALIKELRSPDPRIRKEAFERLRAHDGQPAG